MIHKEKELISEGFTTEYSRTCVMKAWKLTVNVGHANQGMQILICMHMHLDCLMNASSDT